MMIGRLSRRAVAIMIGAAMLMGSGAAVETASAEESDHADVSNIGVSLGKGTTVWAHTQLDQKKVGFDGIPTVTKWRYLSTAGSEDVRVPVDRNGVTKYESIMERAHELGINDKSYLYPAWSIDLERIAIQRAIESPDASHASSRPNGEARSTATSNGQAADGEMVSWGDGDITKVIDQWANERSEYVKFLAGKPHGRYADYLALIDPEVRAYGCAQAKDPDTGRTTSVCEWSKKDIGDWQKTDWVGEKTVQVNVSDDRLAGGMGSNIPSTMVLGKSLTPTAYLKMGSDRYEFRGSWSSSDPRIATIDSRGRLVATGQGSTSIAVAGQGKRFAFPLTVKTKAEKPAPVYRTVSFNSNGGSKVTSQKVVNGAKAKQPASPTRSGYTFAGWYYGSAKWDFSHGVNANITLTAKWTKNTIPSKPTEQVKRVPVYRVYNRHSGLHHYATNKAEKDMLVRLGWRDESRGASFVTVAKDTPGARSVYREYNRRSGNHNWTLNKAEHDMLVRLGWKNEGVAWYAPASGRDVYRLYNRNSGEHVYTMSYGEYLSVVRAGWRGEGVAWKSL